MTTKLTDFLRRFTELPFLLDYLHTREISLLSPATWDDRNDAYFLDLYRAKKKCEAIYALCMTQSAETYHHWKIFSSGASAICIEFKRDKFLDHVKKHGTLLTREITYRTLADIRKNGIDLADLPFTKRKAFEDEREFRVVKVKKASDGPIYRLPIPLGAVNRIVFGPWIPISVAKNIKKSILKIPGCEKLKLERSNLTENSEWKEIAGNAA